MSPGKIKIMVISAGILLIFSIGLLVTSDLFRADTTLTHKVTETIPVREKTLHTNVSEVFFEDQRKQTELLKNLSEQNTQFSVPYEVARMHAEVELARVMYTSSRGLAGTNFTGVMLYPDPVIVYNNSGERPEYYKFYAGVRGFKNILLIVPASKSMGSCCGSGGLGSSDDTSDRIMLQKAQEFYDRNATGSDILSVKFLTSACWGQIIKLDVSSPITNDNSTFYLDYGVLRDQKNCSSRVNTSAQEIPDHIAEWMMSDDYYRTIQKDALAAGINLTEPYSWKNRDEMRNILQSVEIPRGSYAK